MDTLKIEKEGVGELEAASCTNCSHMLVCATAARMNQLLQGFAGSGMVKKGSKKEMQETMNAFEVQATAAQGAACEQYRWTPDMEAV
jgi:hypothetical protein